MNALTSPDAWRATAAELAATFMFVALGISAAGVTLTVAGELTAAGVVAIAFGHGLGIALGVATVGRISGAHMNPAVTIATFVTGNTSALRAVMYIGAQLGGAVLAAGLARYIFGIADLGVHALNDEVLASTGRGFTFELILTGFLVFTVFATAIDRRGNPVIAPFAIGTAIFLIHLAAIPVTGAGVNPARSFGPAAIWTDWADHWVYWVAPIAGGVIAALGYVFVFGEKEDRDRLKAVAIDDADGG